MTHERGREIGERLGGDEDQDLSIQEKGGCRRGKLKKLYMK